MSRTGTLDERIDFFYSMDFPEARQLFGGPFTPDERALARSVAEACYFLETFTELPRQGDPYAPTPGNGPTRSADPGTAGGT
jgi:hypothetical protein